MKRKPMKPMYRTAAEERLIKAAIAHMRPVYLRDEQGHTIETCNDSYLVAAVRAVVRERKEATK